LESNICFDDAVCFDAASTAHRVALGDSRAARAREIIAAPLSQSRSFARHSQEGGCGRMRMSSIVGRRKSVAATPFHPAALVPN
jgi:hypothetical protein